MSMHESGTTLDAVERVLRDLRRTVTEASEASRLAAVRADAEAAAIAPGLRGALMALGKAEAGIDEWALRWAHLPADIESAEKNAEWHVLYESRFEALAAIARIAAAIAREGAP
jgi:hypothetical protein